jgi:hypothetical protein
LGKAAQRFVDEHFATYERMAQPFAAAESETSE